MKKSTGRILKNNDTKIEGRVQLNIIGANQKTPSKRQDAADLEPQVHITESNSEFALIEVKCSCGTTIHLRCEYAAMQNENKAADQTEQTEKIK
ncbi:MAG: hypothetical protein KAI59_06575 [Planctomycetes bacterium]|nr:hypothetical protein [Planctomycetota bacterium]MCK5473681.1 hypothetical protein [Planctomycetota bacterium]